MPEASSGNGKVALHYGEGSELDLPVKSATEGSAGIEVTKLLATTGMVTLDPGFVNTAACSSEITYIDGDAGILRYRGYPIEQLAEKSSLPRGQLPADLRRAAHATTQLPDFTEQITKHTLLDEDLKTFFDGFPRDAHPMPVLSQRRLRAVDLLPGQPQPVRRAERRPVHHPAARQGADAGRLRLQEVGRPAAPLPGQLAELRRELPAAHLRPARPSRTRSTRRSPRPWTCCSSCTPTTSRTAPPPPSASSARARRTCSRASRPASTPCSARCTAAPTRRCSTCSRTSATRAAT